MNKSNSLWGKCILAIACMILCAGIYGEEAHAEEVSLKRGEEVFYEGYSTFYYYINGKLGYCLEPKKSSPHDGTFQAVATRMTGSGNSMLSRMMGCFSSHRVSPVVVFFRPTAAAMSPA